MELNIFSTKTLPQEPPKKKLHDIVTIGIVKDGQITMSKLTADTIGITPKDKISIAQSGKGDWLLFKDNKEGFALTEKNGEEKRAYLRFKHLPLVQLIQESFGVTAEQSLKLHVADEAIAINGSEAKYWEIYMPEDSK